MPSLPGLCLLSLHPVLSLRAAVPIPHPLAVLSVVPHLAEPEGRGASLLHPAQCMIAEERNGGVCSEVHTPILFVSAAVLLVNCLLSIRP